MRALLGLAVILALCAGVCVLWLSRGATPSEERAVTMAEAPSVPAADAPRAEIESPPNQVTAPETAVETPLAKGEHAPVEIPPVDFEAKYKAWSLERLAGAKEMLDTAYKVEFEAICAERLKAGLFEEVITAPGETFTAKEFSGPNKQLSDSTDDGHTRHRTIEVPVSEYPKFEALQQERSWLYVKLRALKKPK